MVKLYPFAITYFFHYSFISYDFASKLYMHFSDSLSTLQAWFLLCLALTLNNVGFWQQSVRRIPPHAMGACEKWQNGTKKNNDFTLTVGFVLCIVQSASSYSPTSKRVDRNQHLSDKKKSFFAISTNKLLQLKNL